MSRSVNPEDLAGLTVISKEGEKIGSIGSIYLADDTGTPEWATVKTGLFGHKESFVPLRDAEVRGDEVTVPVAKSKVSEAPRVDADGHLSTEESQNLYRYYGLDISMPEGDGNTKGRGHDGGDGTITRSEERLRVGTEPVETGRVRLRKYIVTEEQQVRVPVRHEEVRVEREPITDGRPGDHRVEEAEHEVTLHAEKPVVRTETVPVEKVTLGKRTVSEEETVTGKVRKEQIEVTDPSVERRR
ncbi:hypothetical protein CFP71_14980 [Amycolatopsis thailandensis]|uniref:Photosystem reaction center subunit H n=1 Tax=Amycolatopsis thailandensis TaxID=589330 RepID=A0A229SBN1_9PSEU|nr:PRC and DUF2382 domain-containing protein [Amycolatopsis thailandensis]OXM56129.1 hypothetical protein CFP71_14980 [Amycolatopsis thailandensis]